MIFHKQANIQDYFYKRLNAYDYIHVNIKVDSLIIRTYI